MAQAVNVYLKQRRNSALLLVETSKVLCSGYPLR